jgi:hypothetical protein
MISPAAALRLVVLASASRHPAIKERNLIFIPAGKTAQL